MNAASSRRLGVRVIAVCLGALAISGGVLYSLAAYYLSGLSYLDSGGGPPASQMAIDIAMICLIAGGLLLVAVQLWRGSGWARLAAQLELTLAVVACGGYGLGQLNDGNLWGLAGLWIALAPAAGVLHLERPAVRSSFGLSPYGLIGRNLTTGRRIP